MTDEALFAQVLELGRVMGWHDGTGRSRHQEYVNAYRRRVRRNLVLADDEALIRHAALLDRAIVTATIAGGELAALVLEQQRDDKSLTIRRPRNVIGIDEPAAILALRRRALAAQSEAA